MRKALFNMKKTFIILSVVALFYVPSYVGAYHYGGANCALPLYMMALQGGMHPPFTEEQLEANLDDKEDKLEETKNKIKAAKRKVAIRIGDFVVYDVEEGDKATLDDIESDDVIDQIVEYMREDWDRKEAREAYCEDEADDDDEDGDGFDFKRIEPNTPRGSYSKKKLHYVVKYLSSPSAEFNLSLLQWVVFSGIPSAGAGEDVETSSKGNSANTGNEGSCPPNSTQQGDRCFCNTGFKHSSGKSGTFLKGEGSCVKKSSGTTTSGINPSSATGSNTTSQKSTQKILIKKEKIEQELQKRQECRDKGAGFSWNSKTNSCEERIKINPVVTEPNKSLRQRQLEAIENSSDKAKEQSTQTPSDNGKGDAIPDKTAGTTAGGTTADRDPDSLCVDGKNERGPCPGGYSHVNTNNPEETSPEPLPEVDSKPSEECKTWKRWNRCTDKEDEGEIIERLCKSPSKCASKGVPEAEKLEQYVGKNANFKNSKLKRQIGISECQEALKELKTLLQEQKNLKKDIDEIEDSLDSGVTEAGWCADCMEKRLRTIKEIIDPPPTDGQVLGNIVGTLGMAWLGYRGAKQANQLRLRHSLAPQTDYALKLAYPFIMKGLHGHGGVFGNNSSSLACGSTMWNMGGSVFGGNPYFGVPGASPGWPSLGGMGAFGMMPGGMGSFGMMPGGMGSFGMMPGGMDPFSMVGMGSFGMMPGGMGTFVAGGNFVGGMPAGGMFPGGMMPGGMGTFVVGGNFVGGMMPGGMGSFGMMPGMGGVFGGMMPGMGGVFGGMMPGMGAYNTGSMQAYMAWQKSMMAYQQAQMDNYMQKQKSVAQLSQEINRLQQQAMGIMYGTTIGQTTGGNTTGGTKIGGGGDETTTKTKKDSSTTTPRKYRPRKYRSSRAN